MIVVIDDDREIGFVVRKALLNLISGYDVVFAQHGSGAIVQVQAQWVPLVITDYSMPDMDGIEAIKTIKTISPRTRIIAFSGKTDPQVVEALMGAGANFFLQKPFTIPELMACVSEALSTIEG